VLEAVRLVQLTPTYFTHVVPALPWVIEHLPAHKYGVLVAVRTTASCAWVKRAIKHSKLPRAWLNRSVRPPSAAGTTAVLTDCSLTRQVLDEVLLPQLLTSDYAVYTPPKLTKTFAFGYEMWLRPEMAKSKNTVRIGMSAEPALAHDKKANAAWQLAWKVTAQLPNCARGEYVATASTSGDGHASGSSIYYPVLKFPAGKSLTSVADYWDEMVLVDGAMRVKVEVSACNT
jgi:hypothetical protein